MDIRVDTKQAVTDLKKQFAGITNHTSFNTAIAIGLNETMKRAQATANAAVKQRYNLNPAAINRKKLIKVSKANGKNLIAFLRASVQNIPLVSFGGVQQAGIKAEVKKGGTSLRTKTGRYRVATPVGKKGDGGVTVEIIRGQKVQLRGAFLQKMKNGHIGVFARGFKKGAAYSGGKFNWRNKRLTRTGNDSPIVELGAMTMHNLFVNENIQPKVNARISKELVTSLTRAIKFQISKAK